MDSKPILYLSPLPPPQGGIAVWTKKILDTGLPDGTPVIVVNTCIRGNRNIFQAATFSFAESGRSLRILFALLYQIIFNRPCLIHISCSISSAGIFRDLTCAWLARLFFIPVVVHYHGNLQDFNGTRFGGFSLRALRWLMQIANCNIVANSPSLNFANHILGANKPAVLLPNFIEDSIFERSKPVSIRKHLRALFCGGITKAKGCAEILAAAVKFPEIEFHLIGKMHADMEKACDHAGKNVIFHGEVSHDKLLTEMAQSDFLLFPSYTEGFPLTVLEAMSLGIPIISTTVGAIPEMVTDNLGGILVAPRDTAALIIAINQLIARQSELPAMGEYNKQKSYNQYRYSKVVAELVTIYQQILQRREKCVE